MAGKPCARTMVTGDQVVPFEWVMPLGGIAADDDGGAPVALELMAEGDEVRPNFQLLRVAQDLLVFGGR